jgi:hypothetical protein
LFSLPLAAAFLAIELRKSEPKYADEWRLTAQSTPSAEDRFLAQSARS